MHKLFRDSSGEAIKPILNSAEGISFRENPLDFFILLARYKFAARFIKKHHEVLDAGCGHGFGSVFLSQFANNVVGADFDADLIAMNQEQHRNCHNLTFQTINLLETPTNPEKFDVVVSMDVIEHFSKPDTYKVATHYAELVKDGGFAIIGTPNIASQPYASRRRRETHIHEFTPQEFEETLQENFRQVFLFSMTDEVVSTSFNKMAWYLMAICTK